MEYLRRASLISSFMLFPTMFLSGATVPVECMPMELRYLSRLSPMRCYMEFTLAIFLKGVGLECLRQEFLVIFPIGPALFPMIPARSAIQLK